MSRRSVFLCAALLAASCSPSGNVEGSGGSSSSGGSPGTGGHPASGGSSSSSGGSTASGGTSASGGATGSGGAPGTSSGGAQGAGSGGATASGGAAAGGKGGGGGAPSTASGGAGGGASSQGGSPGMGSGDCTRADLQATVAAYLKGLVAHDIKMAPLADKVRYTENTKEVAVGEGLWKTAGAVKLQRDLIDTVQCATVSQVVLPEGSADVVMTQRLKIEGGKITESEAVITRDGDWNFDAKGYLNTKSKTWDVIPADQRTPRDKLIAMPKIYWDYFKNNDPPAPPFGDGCKRVEGGKGAPVNCTAGIPSGVSIGDRRFWADDEAGVSAGIAIFGGTSGLLDVHYFKVTSGTIRDVYAMTLNTSMTGTGWPGGVP